MLDGLEQEQYRKNIFENQGEIVVVSRSILAKVSAVITESLLRLRYCQTIGLDTENGKVFYQC